MFARGVDRGHEPAPELELGVFRCAKCAKALEVEQVMSAEIERRDGAVTGYVLFQHFCACSPAGVRATRAWATHPAFVALFGTQPWLPYRAPFRFQAVAPDDPLVTRWAWELDQVTDGDDLLLFLDDTGGAG